MAGFRHMAQTAYAIDYQIAASEQSAVSAEMFGGNIVATKNTLVPVVRLK